MVDSFISDNNISKYIAGKNIFSKKLIDNYNIRAVIDDFGNKSSWYGLPTIKSAEADPDGTVCSTSTAIYPISTINKIKENGLSRIIHYLDLTKSTNFSFPFIDDAHNDILEFCDKYSEIYHSLADEKSKTTFLDIINFRINKNINHMNGYKVEIEEQYFEIFWNMVMMKFL